METDITSISSPHLNVVIMTDCAVGAFARSFSQASSCRYQHTASSAARIRDTNRNLPVELLLMIFGFAYDDIHQDDDDDAQWTSNSDDSDAKEWPDLDLLSPSLFPYAFASVCSLWRDTMSLVPKFWSRIVILVDSSSTPLSAVESQLSWSRDCEVDIAITRGASDDDVDAKHERAQIVALMNILCFHIHRIRELRFDIMFSSSLPFFPIDFHGNAIVLKRLELKCRVDDGSRDQSKLVPLTEDFQCPNLRSLVIDGRNYYEASNRSARWMVKIAHVRDLTISCFKPRPGELFTPYELFLPFAAIAMSPPTLRIKNLVFHLTEERIPSLPRSYISHLFLEDIRDFQVVQCILMHYNPLVVSLTRCALGTALDRFMYADWDYLELAEISQDLAPFLRNWNGGALEIRDCPRFDDTLLNAMGSQYCDCFDVASFAQELKVHNCPNFSFKAMRRLVESRVDFPIDPESTLDWKINNIIVSGNAPLLTPEERSWFEENIPNFSYC